LKARPHGADSPFENHSRPTNFIKNESDPNLNADLHSGAGSGQYSENHHGKKPLKSLFQFKALKHGAVMCEQ
jgi:hypothetical protein